MVGAVNGVYWLAESGFPVENINSKLFTHIFCGFANIEPTTNNLVIAPEYHKTFFNFSTTVKHKNKDVKTLISVEGPIPKDDVSYFGEMTSDEDGRKAFIASSIALARKYHFDGIDLDWEYPKTELEVKNFGKLLDELRLQADHDGGERRLKPLLLTAKVSCAPKLVGFWGKFINYPYKSMSSNLDWINVKVYDFYSPTRDTDKTETRAPAGLYRSTDDNTSSSNNDVICGSDGIQAWIKAGLKSNKLVLGIPFYGYGWKLTDPDNHGLLAQANGPASGTDQDGIMEYNQIRNFIDTYNANALYFDDVISNYCYKGTKWIVYEGIQTVKTKVTYAIENDLGGYFAWHVGADNIEKDLAKTASNAWNGAYNRSRFWCLPFPFPCFNNNNNKTLGSHHG